MKGKNKKKRALKISLIAMSFVLVMVLGVSLTLAWFYDGDWASNYVQMGGPVGIKIYDNEPADDDDNWTSGANNLHFDLLSSEKAFPGQSIDIKAGIINYGQETTKIVDDNGTLKFDTVRSGSSCYLRAHFAVYTTITDPTFDTSVLCGFVDGLVTEQNEKYDPTGSGTDYYWYYYQNSGTALPLAESSDGTTLKYYTNGKAVTEGTTLIDDGYYYLCGGNKESLPSSTNPDKAYLKELAYLNDNTFLWDSRIIIPWNLTNTSADAIIVVEVRFEAIQTFIPKITDGIISTDANNRVDDYIATGDSAGKDGYQVSVNNASLQTVFQSSDFSSTLDAYEGTIRVSKDASNDYLIHYVDTTTKNPYAPFKKATKNNSSFTQITENVPAITVVAKQS